MAEDYRAWVEAESARRGIKAEESDWQRLEQTNPDDVQRVMDALTSQYDRRAGSDQGIEYADSQVYSDQGYGSARSETADDPRATGSTGGSRTTSTQSWLGSGGGGNTTGAGAASSMFPDWYRDLMERQMSQAEAARAENKARADALFGDLSNRMNQSLAIDRNDPIIRAQADAFSANQERARRNYLSDVAERSSPLANLTGERRMAAERYGQTTGAYEAGLVADERAARRNEIAEAYRMAAGMLSGDQVRQLQEQLAGVDTAHREAGLGVQYDLGLRSNDLGLRNLGLQDWDRQMYWDMLQRGAF